MTDSILQRTQNARGKKVSICIVGTGEWGSKIEAIFQLHGYFNVVGTINSKTAQDEKERIIKESEFVYLAVPSDVQYEYLMLAIRENKKIICESPFLNTIDMRRMVRQTLARVSNTNFLYVNYPYLFDPLYMSISGDLAIKDRINYLDITCSGPKYQDNPDLAKKLYSNQALAVAFKSAEFKGMFFSSIDFKEKFGEIKFNGNLFIRFAYGYSEENRIQILARGSQYSQDRNFTYDEFDQVVPMLNFFMMYNKNPEKSTLMNQNGAKTFVDEAIKIEMISDLFVGLKGAEYTLDASKYLLDATIAQ